ncbi:twin-arginine translocation signal domain-containing protein [Dietzia sp. PP-33]|uniref:twin-arginine translocation signal domain-containing protein n=1 Tax=Dietzia sp. PP-33 TaxID=2957500 RepID=UPI0029B38D04|nr:twin-arginine translocation signal domain-containing protein [Dietzia sp. PP-33]MDX2355603.1 twin-arginine translocation signal domain-containing protein [Dietzia sp. PP-33]
MHSSPAAPVSRRRFVAVSAVVTGLAAVGGCALPVVDDAPDPLVQLAEAADRDARELAAADVSHGDDVARLRRIAEARRTHFERLSAEIGRQTTTGEAPPDDVATEDGVATDRPVTCPPVEEVRARLREDARRAAEVAVDSRGSRAEVTAAVSAACTAAVEVVLA